MKQNIKTPKGWKEKDWKDHQETEINDLVVKNKKAPNCSAPKGLPQGLTPS